MSEWQQQEAARQRAAAQAAQDALERARTAPKPAVTSVTPAQAQKIREAVFTAESTKPKVSAAETAMVREAGFTKSTQAVPKDYADVGSRATFGTPEYKAGLETTMLTQQQKSFQAYENSYKTYSTNVQTALDQYDQINSSNSWDSYDWSQYVSEKHGTGRNAYEADIRDLGADYAERKKEHQDYSSSFDEYVTAKGKQIGSLKYMGESQREALEHTPEYIQHPSTFEGKPTDPKIARLLQDGTIAPVYSTTRVGKTSSIASTQVVGYKVSVPVSQITPEMRAILESAGFHFPPLAQIPKGLSVQLLEWGMAQGDPDWQSKPLDKRTIGDFVRSQVAYYTPGLATAILNPAEDVARWAGAIIFRDIKSTGGTGVTGHETEIARGISPTPIEQITLDTMGKYKDIANIPKPLLYGSIAGINLLTAYAESLAAGDVLGRIITSGQEIAIHQGINTASRIAKISDYIMSKPRLLNMLLWSPVVGISAYEVYSDFISGIPYEDIAGRLAVRASTMIGGIKGFQKGLQMGLTNSEIRTLNKIVSGGGNVGEEFEVRKGPKWFVDSILSGEVTPIKGDEAIVGFKVIEEGGAKIEIPISAKFEQLTQDLINGKRLGQIGYIEAIQKNMSPEEFGLLVSRYGNLTMYTPEDLTLLMYKELGSGTGIWDIKLQGALTELGSKSTRINVVGLLSDSDKVRFNLSTENIKLWETIDKAIPSPYDFSMTTGALDTADSIRKVTASGTSYSMLVKTLGSGAQASETAQMIVQETILHGATAGITTAMVLAPTLSNSEMQSVAVLVAAIAKVDIAPQLKAAGVSFQSYAPVIAALANPSTIPANIDRLDKPSIQLILPNIKTENFQKFDTNTLMRLIEKSDNDLAVITATIEKASTAQANDLISKLDQPQLNDVISELSTAQITDLVQKLDVPQLNTVLEIFINTPNFKIFYIPKLPPPLRNAVNRYLEYKDRARHIFEVTLPEVSVWTGAADSFHEALGKAIRDRDKPYPTYAMIRKLK